MVLQKNVNPYPPWSIDIGRGWPMKSSDWGIGIRPLQAKKLG